MSSTRDEFLSAMKLRGAIIAPAAPVRATALANTALQNLRAAMLPTFLLDMYKTADTINIGNGYIFGISEFARGAKFPVPDIVSINRELSGIKKLRGLTLFGRNDLFWFAFDSFGTCMMLDNLNLGVLRKYDNPYRAMSDCLLGGKF